MMSPRRGRRTGDGRRGPLDAAGTRGAKVRGVARGCLIVLLDAVFVRSAVALSFRGSQSYAPRWRSIATRATSRTVSGLLPPFARRTIRLQTLQAAIGVALGGEASARLLPKLRMNASADTILRDVRLQEVSAWPTPRVLGVDDWAFRKGRTYGTILVDLERHAVIDVLEDRISGTLSAWLQAHPGVEIIARDRSTEYTKAIREGAPDAVQVADRWHLLQSARHLLERYLPSIHARLRRLPNIVKDEEPAWLRSHAFPRTRAEAEIGSQAREERRLTYEKVKELRTVNWGIATIAREIGIDRKTARKYARAEAFPERGRQVPRESLLDPFLPYLHERWKEGCENASLLWREIRERGYAGTKKQVLRWMSTRRRIPSKHDPHKANRASEPPDVLESPRPKPLVGPMRLAWLLCRNPLELDATEAATIERVRQDPELAALHSTTR